jgi:hypothetical protein
MEGGSHMTVVETSTNGKVPLSTRERIRQVRDEHDANITGTKIAELLDIPVSTANYHLRALAGEQERFAANGGSSASGVLPPPKPAPRAISPQVKGKAGSLSSPRSKARRLADRGPLDWAVIAIVGITVAAVSYSHIVDLAILAGHGWRAYLAPIALDGLAIAAIRAWQVGQHRRVAAVGIAVGIIGSVAANVLAVRPELVDLADVSAVLAAFPPIALAVIVHLVRR